MSGSSLLTLNCLIFGNDADSIFPVKIKNMESVGSLRVAIRNENRITFQNVEANSLDLWMVSILVNEDINEMLEELALQNDSDNGVLKLLPTCILFKYFSAKPPDWHIHIIMQPWHAGEYHYLIHSSNALYLLQSQLLLQFNFPFPISPTSNQCTQAKFVADTPNKPPSSQGQLSAFAKLQQKDKCKYNWNCPPSAALMIPVTLLHPIFAQFVDDCENHIPSREENELVLVLSRTMCEFFPSEKKWTVALEDVLAEHSIEMAAMVISSTEYMNDGNMQLCWDQE